MEISKTLCDYEIVHHSFSIIHFSYNVVVCLLKHKPTGLGQSVPNLTSSSFPFWDGGPWVGAWVRYTVVTWMAHLPCPGKWILSHHRLNDQRQEMAVKAMNCSHQLLYLNHLDRWPHPFTYKSSIKYTLYEITIFLSLEKESDHTLLRLSMMYLQVQAYW